MWIFAFVYTAVLVAAILFAAVCMFIPKLRVWPKYISAGAAGSFCGVIVANVIGIASLATLSSLGLKPRLYPAGTVFGPLGPSTTDWFGVGTSVIGVLVGIASGMKLLRMKHKAPSSNS
jgi:hypothetical protein